MINETNSQAALQFNIFAGIVTFSWRAGSYLAQLADEVGRPDTNLAQFDTRHPAPTEPSDHT